jgi:hypothetical protein
MFDQLFTSPKTVARYSSGPLLEERLGYLAHCAAQGSTRSSLRLIAQHQLIFVDHLRLQEAGSRTVEQIKAAGLAVNLNRTPTMQPTIDGRGGGLSLMPDNGSPS